MAPRNRRKEPSRSRKTNAPPEQRANRGQVLPLHPTARMAKIRTAKTKAARARATDKKARKATAAPSSPVPRRPTAMATRDRKRLQASRRLAPTASLTRRPAKVRRAVPPGTRRTRKRPSLPNRATPSRPPARAVVTPARPHPHRARQRKAKAPPVARCLAFPGSFSRRSRIRSLLARPTPAASNPLPMPA